MRASDQMKEIEREIARIRAERERLAAQEDVLVSLLAKIRGGEGSERKARKRSPNIKPLVLDIMGEVGFTGATTAEVDAAVRQKVPEVAPHSVGSILSRLKSAGALVHDGARYYEKRFAPRPPEGNGQSLRAVN
jgi:hypothetical protein